MAYNAKRLAEPQFPVGSAHLSFSGKPTSFGTDPVTNSNDCSGLLGCEVLNEHHISIFHTWLDNGDALMVWPDREDAKHAILTRLQCICLADSQETRRLTVAKFEILFTTIESNSNLTMDA